MNHFKHLLLIAALASPAHGQTVIDIASSDVTAGSLSSEIAAFAQADPAFVVARAPAPGVSRRIARVELLRWANGLGLDPQQLPDELILRRAMRMLTHAEIEQAASAEIEADDVSIEILSGGSPSVPAGDISIECLCNRVALNRPTPLRLRWREPGGRTGIELVQAVISVEGRWLEAVADLPAGTALMPSDVVEKHGALPKLNSYLTINQIDGRLILMRFIKSGQSLTDALVRSVPLVSRGDLVELRYEFGGIRLRSPGRAEASGSTGDLMPFHNVATGGRVSARLADQETAYVEAAHAAR
jgi:flagella basal body P-ring formation protein FlgA